MELRTKDKKLEKNLKTEYSKLPESVKEHISNETLEYMYSHLLTITECESPIEQLLGISLSINISRLDIFSEACSLKLQENIKANGKNYRADFVIDAVKGNRSVSYVIECDGHDFHEKTKEQARQDKQRDRNLMSAGYKVLRFTGSEIYKNPQSCANEIIRLVIKDLMSGD